MLQTSPTTPLPSMRTQNLKNRLAFGAKRIAMSDDTYALRTRVMNIIRLAKSRVPNFPRIEVRIVDLAGSATMGYAYMGQNIIHIDRHEATRDDSRLLALVLHELLHAVLSTPHIDSCPLMSGSYRPLSQDQSWRIFLQYF